MAGIALLTLIVALPTRGDDVTAIATVNRNPIGLGEKLYLTIELTYDDVSKARVTKAKWPEGVAVLSGPTIRTYVDAADTKHPRKVRIYYSFRGDKIGRLVFEPVRVRAGDIDAETEPFIVGIGYWRNRQLYIPLLCRWRVDAAQVIAGQTFRVVLMLHDMTEIPSIGTVTIPTVPGAFVDEIDEIGPLERVIVGSESIFQLPIAAYLVTPSVAGTISLPAVRVVVGELIVESNAVDVRVLPLPGAIAATGAIGSFEYDTVLLPSDILVGEEVEVLLGINGVGNLNYLELPEVSYEGLILAGKEPVDDFTPEFGGYIGYKGVRYIFFAQSAGVSKIEIPSFMWLESGSGRIVTVDSQSASARVSPREVDETVDVFPFLLETSRQIASHRRRHAYLDAKNYLLLLPGALAIYVLFALKRAGIVFVAAVSLLTLPGAGHFESNDRIDLATAAYASADYDHASELFRLELMENPGNPGLLYNRSVAEYRAGRYVSAIRYVRLAIIRAPSNRRYREFGVWMNDELLLPEIVFPVFNVDPDLLFFLFLGFATAAMGIGVVHLAKSRGTTAILGILSLTCAVVLGASLGAVHRQNARLTGVISAEEAELRSIPNGTAMVRLELPRGASLRIVDIIDQFCLVETGVGQSGWVPIDTLLID